MENTREITKETRVNYKGNYKMETRAPLASVHSHSTVLFAGSLDTLRFWPMSEGEEGFVYEGEPAVSDDLQ